MLFGIFSKTKKKDDLILKRMFRRQARKNLRNIKRVRRTKYFNFIKN